MTVDKYVTVAKFLFPTSTLLPNIMSLFKQSFYYQTKDRIVHYTNPDVQKLFPDVDVILLLNLNLYSEEYFQSYSRNLYIFCILYLPLISGCSGFKLTILDPVISPVFCNP